MAIVGAGRAGTAFGVLLERAGHHVPSVSGGPSTEARARRYLPAASFVPITHAHRATAASGVVILAVPDDRIDAVCTKLAARQGFRSGQFVLHLSGSRGLDPLAPAAALGAEVLSLHPLQTFPDVEAGVERLPGSPIAVTGRTEQARTFGQWLARQVGGAPFELDEEVKPLYHSAAVFCSNYLVAVQGMAEELFGLAGLPGSRDLFAPLARASLDAALDRGPGRALTGPAARGDTGTVARNLVALRERAPQAIESYVALARVAARLARSAGRLTDEQVRRMDQELAAWR